MKKHFVVTLVAIALVAGAAGMVAFRAAGNPTVEQALAKKDAMGWMRADFGLTDAQFDAIQKLHDAYSLVCEEHCREIQKASHVRAVLRAAPQSDAAALAAADRRVEELQQICESAIATHVRQCASHMPPEAAQRYLALVLPKIKDFDHVAPPDLQLNRHQH